MKQTAEAYLTQLPAPISAVDRALEAVERYLQQKHAQRGDIQDARHLASQNMIQANGFYYEADLPLAAELARVDVEIAIVEHQLEPAHS
jgi:hypothetical protein